VRLRSVAVLSAFITALAALVAIGPATEARHARAADWTSMSSHWPARQGVNVSDVAAFGKVAFAVGTTTKNKIHTPWVQLCTGRSCKATRLLRPHGDSTVVTSVAGSDRSDVWAVGWRIDAKTKEHRPVFWHKAGADWKVFNAGFELNHNIVLTKVEVANKSKAFALGRYRHGDKPKAVTSTVYRWNGNGWKEVADLDHRSEFAAPCEGWYQRDWVDVIARPGSAILVGRCGTKHKLAVLEQGDTTWSLMSGDGLPDGVSWRVGTMVGRQAWMVGDIGKRRVIVANDGSGWKRVTTKGIRPLGTVTDLAGVFASKVTAVGSVPTGGGHRVAKAWRWGAGSWHETSIPTGISRSGLSAVSVEGNGPVFAIGQDMARRPALRAIIVHSLG
jgi:hypothetical protein